MAGDGGGANGQVVLAAYMQAAQLGKVAGVASGPGTGAADAGRVYIPE
jgi:hypothetical protein